MADPLSGPQGDIRPVPDPTVLTTEASSRLEKMLRHLIASEVTHLEVLFNERIARIEMQFRMLDARTAEQKQDTTNALNAALAAQKEAVAAQTASSEKSITKSETATTERIKGVETLLSTSTKATDDKITDLKDRVVAIESIKLGNAEGAAVVRQSGYDSRAVLASVIGVILVLISIAGFLAAFLKP